MIQWDETSEAYQFETETLSGGIRPYDVYHGISRLVHKGIGKDVILPDKALLNAEYYHDEHTVRRGNEFGQRIFPRRTSEAKLTRHSASGDCVSIFFPDDLCAPDLKLEMEMTYTIAGVDTIDLDITIVPKQDSEGFELFIASYILDWVGLTYVPARTEGGFAWHRFDKDQSPSAGPRRTYHYFRDQQAAMWFADGRHPHIEELAEPWFYAYPITVVLDDAGYGLVQFAERETCLAQAGQHHDENSARDLSLGGPLKADVPFTTHVRLMYRQFPDGEEQTLHEIIRLCEEFTGEDK